METSTISSFAVALMNTPRRLDARFGSDSPVPAPPERMTALWPTIALTVLV
jgi:hypothetical protein